MYPDPPSGFPGKTYRYFNASGLPGGGVQYPFGFGLSYTTWAYSGVAVSPPAPAPCDTVNVTVTLANTGGVDGAEVVQLYVTQVGASVPAPIRALAAFARVWVPAGGATTLTLSIPPRLNSLMRDGDYLDVVSPGARDLWVGGASDPAAAPGVAASFAVTGAPTPVVQCEGAGLRR